jgi:hypothetical protein
VSKLNDWRKNRRPNEFKESLKGKPKRILKLLFENLNVNGKRIKNTFFNNYVDKNLL